MKSIEERAAIYFGVLEEKRLRRVVFEDILRELADDLNAEKEKEVAELKKKLATLAKDYSEAVAGEPEMEEPTRLRAWKESALKVTPRCDAMMKYCFGDDREFIPIEKARELETELTATRARLAELEGIAEKLYDAVTHCAQMADTGIRAYKEGKK